MELISSIYNAIPGFVWQILSWAETACAILFIYFSSKYRNTKLPLRWYIFAFFMPLIAVLVYLFRERKYHKKIEVKVCEGCGKTYPANFEYCSDCLSELPEYKPEKKKQQKTLATVFVGLFAVLYIFNLISGSYVISAGLKGFDAYASAESRIAFEDVDKALVYYDRNGEAYHDELDVVLYDREGNIYYFTFEEGEMCFYKDEGEDEWNEDNVLIGKNCFIDESGYFVCFDENAPARIIEDGNEPEYYFEAPYTDSEGNIYYSAFEASWTPEGELITSKEQLK